MAAATVSDVWIDSLRPIVGPDGRLQEVIAIINLRYVDDSGQSLFVSSKSVSSLSIMTPEQQVLVTSIYQAMIDGFKSQFVGTV